MTKRKNVVSKMLLLVVILTLISCCFLGSTFARYTSDGNGSATLNVAKWAIDIKGGATEGGMSVNFAEKLSPSKYDYNTTVDGEYTANTVRSNSTGKLLIATINNTGDVGALVTVTAGGVVVNTEAVYSDPTEAEVKEVFSIKLWYGTTNDAEKATTEITSGSTKIPLNATNGVIYIYAEVIWTSDTENITGTDADERDTWIGKNVTSVSYNISYKAVQNTELPNA